MVHIYVIAFVLFELSVVSLSSNRYAGSILMKVSWPVLHHEQRSRCYLQLELSCTLNTLVCLFDCELCFAFVWFAMSCCICYDRIATTFVGHAQPCCSSLLNGVNNSRHVCSFYTGSLSTTDLGRAMALCLEGCACLGAIMRSTLTEAAQKRIKKLAAKPAV